MPIRSIFGSWDVFLKEFNLKPLKFIPTKNGITRKGTRNKSRKKIINQNGYVEVFEPSHPTAMSNGYCLEHRLIAWDHGELVDLRDIVHHDNGIKTDNFIKNLEVMKNSDHTYLHFKGKRVPRRNSIKCRFDNCDELTASKYILCTKHYKLQWGRIKNGLIENMNDIYEHGHLIKG